MAVRNEQKAEQKQGLLAYGYEVGQRLPFFPEDVPHRVGKDGSVEWPPIPDYFKFALNASADLGGFGHKKEDRIYHWIFRGWNLLLRALEGLPTRFDWAGVSFDDLMGIYPLQAPSYWERAPDQINALALRSAYEYLKRT